MVWHYKNTDGVMSNYAGFYPKLVYTVTRTFQFLMFFKFHVHAPLALRTKSHSSQKCAVLDQRTSNTLSTTFKIVIL